MPSIRKKPEKPIGIEHHVPGRTRIRLHKSHAKSEHGRRVHEELAKLPGVKSVGFNDRTGSLVIEHHDHPDMLESITGLTGQMATEMLELVVEAEQIEVAEILFLGGMLLTGALDLIGKKVRPSREPGLVHHTQGRTRLKVHDHQSDAEYLAHVSGNLKNVKGVRDVTFNHKTGSIIVHHDSKHETLKAVGEVLSELSRDLFQSIIKGEDATSAGVHAFADLLSKSNQQEEHEDSPFRHVLVAAAMY
ncbi:MAG: hypothetical protein K8F91_24340, partial [Candidatus Obscuribacterales bacterium]|nr:hypothetical protein [Candidatus Obscuribacterales bacterium]